MTLVAWSCVALLNLSACVRVPSFMDRHAAAIAMRAVNGYRKILSRRTGRTCLFRKTCSHATIDYLAKFGWNEGIALARKRVRSCGGTFTLTTDVFGRAVLTTDDGTVVCHDELSEAVNSRCGDNRSVDSTRSTACATRP